MVRRNDSQSKKDEEVKTMDKMFELINSLNALTKAVTALTEKITSEYDSEKDEPQEITAKEQPTPEQQTVTFVELRSRLSEISRNGHTAEVKELLRKFGADKLSDVAESDYTALLAEAEVIANAG